jgi:hypothetical protein
MNRHRALRRGFTLLEQVMSCALLTVVLGLTWQILAPNLRAWDMSRGRADVEQQSLVMQSRLAEELRNSTMASVTISTTPPGFCFATLDTSSPYDTSSGHPLWNGLVLYVLDTENQVLYRKASSLSALQLPTDHLPLMPIATLVGFEQADTAAQNVVASYVIGLTVQKLSSAELHVDVQFAWPSEGGVAVFDRVTDVLMRNLGT